MPASTLEFAVAVTILCCRWRTMIYCIEIGWQCLDIALLWEMCIKSKPGFTKRTLEKLSWGWAGFQTCPGHQSGKTRGTDQSARSWQQKKLPKFQITVQLMTMEGWRTTPLTWWSSFLVCFRDSSTVSDFATQCQSVSTFSQGRCSGPTHNYNSF